MRVLHKTLLAAAALLAVAGATAQDEVPFITTPDAVTLAMLELAGVGPKDRLVDLGSGDGRIVITAARRFGTPGLGVEIVPDLVQQSRRNAQKAGVADRSEFREQDLFTLDLAPYSVITMYLLPQVNLQLRPRLLALKPGTRIVSHDWDLGDWKPDRSLTLDVPDKPIGREKSSTLHLWVVPARLAGWWCRGEQAVHVAQQFQRVSVTLQRAGSAAPPLVFDGRAGADGLHDGPERQSATVVAELEPAADAPRLRFTRVPASAWGFDGAGFRRSASAEGCVAPR